MNIQSPILNVLNKTIRISGKKMIRDFSEIEKLQSSVKNIEKFIEITKLNTLNDSCIIHITHKKTVYNKVDKIIKIVDNIPVIIDVN